MVSYKQFVVKIKTCPLIHCIIFVVEVSVWYRFENSVIVASLISDLLIQGLGASFFGSWPEGHVLFMFWFWSRYRRRAAEVRDKSDPVLPVLSGGNPERLSWNQRSPTKNSHDSSVNWNDSVKPDGAEIFAGASLLL